MDAKLLLRRACICCGAAALLLSLDSCRGRRASDMVPDGDTVECDIDTLVNVLPMAESEIQPDSITQ